MFVICSRGKVNDGAPARTRRWFIDLDAQAAAKVAVAPARLEPGNLSSAKGVGEGVLEYRIDWGPDTECISAATATCW